MTAQPVVPEACDPRQVVVGIDAGGTSTRARATQAGHVVHEGQGGPGNPRGVDAPSLFAHYKAALRGCPPPARITAAVAGAGGAASQARVREVLQELYPQTRVKVTPDYVGAYHALPAGTDLCVVAGTGSVVCSPNPDGSWAVSGGRGWILGDHGSAARLGQALLEWYVEDPAALPDDTRRGVRALFGSRNWTEVVVAVQSSTAPAALLASAAPMLTSLADHGHEHAVGLVRQQMTCLARTIQRHVREHLGRPPAVTVSAGLVGGVWKAPSARLLLADALDGRGGGVAIDETSAPPDPVDGALKLALNEAGVA